MKELNLAQETTASSINFAINRPYLRIVQEIGSPKIAKVLILLDNSTNKESITFNKNKDGKNIHCIVDINLKKGIVNTGYKIVEIELDNNNVEMNDHFNNDNSFLIVNCVIDKTIVGSMTIASYQNGGTVDRPPFIG